MASTSTDLPDSSAPTLLWKVLHPFGVPLHPSVAAVAIGSWVASVVFDAVSRVSDTEFVYARGAYVLTAIGVAAAVVATLIGLTDLLTLDRGGAPFRTGVRHLLAMDVALVLFTVSFLIRRQSDFQFHDPTIAIATIVSLAGLLALAVGIWHASRLVYVHGVGRVEPADGSDDTEARDD